MQGTGAEVEKYMKHLDLNEKIIYTDEPIKFGKILKDDFLPSPAELAKEDKSIKVTISLSRESVDFFKKAAVKHGGQYQKMIRKLLTEYTKRARSTSNEVL